MGLSQRLSLPSKEMSILDVPCRACAPAAFSISIAALLYDLEQGPQAEMDYLKIHVLPPQHSPRWHAQRMTASTRATPGRWWPSCRSIPAPRTADCRFLGRVFVDCHWVGSLGFNFLENQGGVHTPKKLKTFCRGQQQPSLGE